jgi:hypothetical protein
METVALVILGWVAANLVIGAVWTTYCVWPRKTRRRCFGAQRISPHVVKR